MVKNWKIIQSIKIGSKHIAASSPCQDYLTIGSSHGVLSLIQADGAGSARFSESGARIASESIKHQLTSSKFSLECIKEVYNCLCDEARLQNISVKDLASTLAGVQIHDDIILNGIPHTNFTAFQLGDSVLGVWLDKPSLHITEDVSFEEAIKDLDTSQKAFEGCFKNCDEEKDEIEGEFKEVGRNVSLASEKRLEREEEHSELLGNVPSTTSENLEIDRSSSLRQDTSENVSGKDSKEESGENLKTQGNYINSGQNFNAYKKPGQSSEMVFPLMFPEHGEFINQTWMTTSDDAVEHVQSFDCEVDGVKGFVLMSDGTASCLYDDKKKKFAPAMLKLFKMISRLSVDEAQKSLDDIMDHIISKKTSDDCSLLIAVREEDIENGL